MIHKGNLIYCPDDSIQFYCRKDSKNSDRPGNPCEAAEASVTCSADVHLLATFR